MSQTFHSSKSKIFERAGLPMQQIYFWNEVQANFSKNGFTFIEYASVQDEEYIWKCILELKSPIPSNSSLGTEKFNGDLFNANLEKQFSNRESYSNSFWESFMNNIKWSGFYIPVNDFTYNTNDQLKSELLHGYLLCNHFKTTDYLISLKKDSINSEFINDPMALLGIWNFLVFYEDFLHICETDELIKEEPIPNWYSRNFSFRKFHNFLPSKQLSIMLMTAVEVRNDSAKNKKLLERILHRAHSSVVAFYDKYHQEFSTGNHAASKRLFSENMKKDYIDCCRNDLKILAAMEICDESNSEKWQDLLSANIRAEITQNQSKNIFEKIRNALSELSIMDTLWLNSFGNSPKPKLYFPKNTTAKPKPIQNDIPESLVDKIDELSIEFPDEVKASLQEKVQRKWSSELMELSNTLTSPIFIWEEIGKLTIPQWNLMSNNSAAKFQKAFYKKQESLSKQKRRLKKSLTQLQTFKTIEEVDEFISTVSAFFDPLLRNRWEMKIMQHKDAIEGMKHYRESRMFELGIKKKDDPVDFRTDIWLDEMLSIENEIKNYIPFVKKAFSAVLPIRKTLAFNDEQHSQSGIEFDPSTINDQNKWLRGEVMKTIREKTKLGEIEQINAFCLDYSGSMRHERMRNLFKILYLLVLGLEDRKSYDAFHFFNTNFIEGSNFNEEFTNRKLLFKILSKISTIKDGRVLYGGIMGTNIGQGVQECHHRILNFKEKIAQRKPNSKFACSMFVITDGEPSVGIISLNDLNSFISEKRDDGNIAIKGIYIKCKEDENNFMEAIFGENEFVETVEFQEAVNKFVSIMTKTYKEQRKAQKWEAKREANRTNN